MPTALVALLLVLLGAPTAALAAPAPAPPAGDVAEAFPGAGPAGPVGEQAQTTTPNGTAAGPPPVDPANSTITVRIRPNGDARWQITTTFRLTSDADVKSFQSLASAFEQGNSAGLGFQAFKRGAALASEATGRQMTISDPLRTPSLPSEIPGNGTLTLAFTWSNFAQKQNDTVVVGDAFDTSPRWLKGLGPAQKLRLRPPEGWEIVKSPGVPLRNRALVWEGPAEFDGDDISATFGSSAGGPGTDENGSGDGPAGNLLVLVGGTALLLVAGLLVFRVLYQPDEAPADEEAAPEAETEGPAAEGDEEQEQETTGDGEPPDATAAEAETDDEGGEADEEVAMELLSDEERIERLLEENGGRMKQANIVKETGWSNAKVSQLLSSMDEEERIDKLRIGRENLISFPDEDVTDAENKN